MSDKQWLKPVEALTRFSPQQHFHLGQEESLDEFVVRYGYRVGKFGFLIRAETRSEVVDDHAIHPIPLAESFVRGIVNLRGNLVPVFDLNPLLSPVNVASQSSTVLVIGASGDEVGVLIDDIPRTVYDAGNRGSPPALPESFDAFIQETIPQAGIDWVEFDCQAFFQACATNQISLVHDN